MAKAKKVSDIWKEVGAATVGAAVGGVLGMLFAPASGATTRKNVVKKTRQVASATKKAVVRAEKEVGKAAKKVGKEVAKRTHKTA